MLLFRGGMENPPDLVCNPAKISGADSGSSVARLDLRYSRERGEHAQDGIEIRHRVVDQRLVMLALTLARVGPLQPPAHPGQRRPQIVRYAVGDLPHLGHQRFYALKHRIEVLSKLIPFVPRPAQRYPLAEAALHDSSAGCVDCLNPPYSAPRDRNAGSRSKNKYQRDDQCQGGGDLLRQLIEIAYVFSNQQMVPVRKRFKRCSQQRSVLRIRLQGARTEVAPTLDAPQLGGPDLKITCHRREGGIGEQIEAALETTVGNTALYRCNQPTASRSLVSFVQDSTLRRDRAIRLAQHVGRGRPVDIAEKRDDDGAE